MLAEACFVGSEKLLRRRAGMIACPIMDQKETRLRLRHDHLQDGLVIFRIEPARNALREPTPRTVLNGPKDFVAFALATRGHLRLVPTAGPGVAQRAPLRKTGFIFEEDQAFATLGRPDNRRPLVLQPGQALDRVEMVRDKARLLKRTSQGVEQRTPIMPVVEYAELAPNQYAEEDRVPTGRLKTHDERTGLNQLDQAFLLFRRQLL